MTIQQEEQLRRKQDRAVRTAYLAKARQGPDPERIAAEPMRIVDERDPGNDNDSWFTWLAVLAIYALLVWLLYWAVE